MTETYRLRLPEIAAAQAQKHVTHNEALNFLDTLVQASVLDKDLTAPPGSPTEGDCYIVAGGGGTATGEWTSWEKRIVRFQDGQWMSFLPGVGNGVGWTVWVQDEKTLYTYDGTNWTNALRGKTGGGISVQYVFDATTSDADPGSGKLRLNQATQNTATVIRADLADVNGTDWTAALASLADSTSAVKGHLRLFSVADPSKWLLFTVSAVASPSGYKNITVANVSSSAASPFANGDGIVLSFSRTGDQGTAGANGSNGTNGTNGTNGLDGTNPGTRWLFASSTSMADPSAGNARFNNATLSSATAIALSANSGESGNPSVSGWVNTWDDSTNSVKGFLLVKKVSAPQNFRIYQLTALADNTSWLQLTVAHIAGNGSFAASDVLSFEFVRAGDAGGGSGGSNSICDGRLTLSSGTPVLTGDVTAAASVYFTPYKGNKIALYNGSSWDVISFTETSLSLSGLAANTNYDIFGYNNSGTLALEALAWTDATTRATALARQDGVWCKTGALTRRYLGTLRTTGTTGQSEFKFGGSASGGSPASLLVWNAQNRVRVTARVREADANWTYATNTIRPYNNSTNNRISFVLGLPDDTIEAFLNAAAYTQASSRVATGGIGLDTTTAFSSNRFFVYNNAGANQVGCFVSYSPGPLLGFHYFQALECANSAASVTFYGGAGQDEALEAELWM